VVRQSHPDFVEALARGLDIITAFSPTAMALTVSDVAARTSLPRPTARRLLLTLDLGAGPAAPRGTRRADRRVELDVTARR
jgi:IclR family transcriptional regulator, pca regulon regulatory protein